MAFPTSPLTVLPPNRRGCVTGRRRFWCLPMNFAVGPSYTRILNIVLRAWYYFFLPYGRLKLSICVLFVRKPSVVRCHFASHAARTQAYEL
jgi:hypothetical protein